MCHWILYDALSRPITSDRHRRCACMRAPLVLLSCSSMVSASPHAHAHPTSSRLDNTRQILKEARQGCCELICDTPVVPCCFCSWHRSLWCQAGSGGQARLHAYPTDYQLVVGDPGSSQLVSYPQQWKYKNQLMYALDLLKAQAAAVSHSLCSRLNVTLQCALPIDTHHPQAWLHGRMGVCCLLSQWPYHSIARTRCPPHTDSER